MMVMTTAHGDQDMRHKCLELLARSLGDDSGHSNQSEPAAKHGDQLLCNADSSGWEVVWQAVLAVSHAREIERAAWSQSRNSENLDPARTYKAKIRFLAGVLRQDGELRCQCLEGRILAQDLVCRPEETFLSETRLNERKLQREEGLRAVWLQERGFDFYDEQLQCPRCGSIGARYSVLRDSWLLPRCGGCMGHMRKDNGKHILVECAILTCGERWEQEGTV